MLSMFENPSKALGSTQGSPLILLLNLVLLLPESRLSDYIHPEPLTQTDAEQGVSRELSICSNAAKDSPRRRGR